MKKNFRVLQSCLTFHYFTRRKISFKSHQKLLIPNDNISWIGVNMMNRHFSSNSKEMENIVRSPYAEVVIPKMPLPNFLWDENSKILGDKVALEEAFTGTRYTFSEAKEASKKIGSSLCRMGFEEDDVIAFFLHNCPDYITCLTGAIGAGIVVTPINPAYTSGELAKQLQLSNSKGIITTSDSLPLVKKALAQLQSMKAFKVIVLDNACKDSDIILLKEMLKDDGSAYPINRKFDPHKTAMLPYSSGTTGLPKGVMLTSNNIVSNICQQASSELKFVAQATENFQPKTICIMPMFHAFINVSVLPTLRGGGQVIILPKFDPKEFARALIEYKPTILHLAPPVVLFLANNSDITKQHLESVKTILVGAAPVGEALVNQFLEKAPHVSFREGWGMTETSPIGLLAPVDDLKVGSCGVLLPNTEAKIVDLESGKSLEPNQRGELCVKGPQVMKGYFKNKEATINTLKEGWLHSGDIAYYDESGKFYIVDRLKELIKVKGYQVPPAELEDLLRSHPDILDVGVIGIPDERKGEVPLAYVVKKPESDLSTEKIHSFVESHVVSYKRLAGGVQFIDSIPKTSSGKILRRNLKELYMSKQS